MLVVTPFYAAALAVLFIILSARVIAGRRTGRVLIGAGGDAGLERRIRVQANFAEYAPFTLLLLVIAEVRGAPPLWLHLLGVCLLVGRVVHAAGVSRVREDTRIRIIGMVLTFTALAGAALLGVLPR